jgi:hypothetical protein
MRLTLKQTEYLGDEMGRVQGGTVVDVDDATGERWLRRGIASVPKTGDMTAAEAKRAEALRMLAELGDDTSQYSHAITRETADRGKAPARRGRRAQREDLEGAEIVNAAEDDDEDEDTADEPPSRKK